MYEESVHESLMRLRRSCRRLQVGVFESNVSDVAFARDGFTSGRARSDRLRHGESDAPE